MCLLLAISAATADEDLVKDRQNVILIQKIGQIHGGVRMGYLKMTLDSQVVFKRMEKIESYRNMVLK